MNIIDLHSREKSVSAVSLFKSDQANVTALQILEGERLKEHITKVPALLICISGKSLFENEKGAINTIMPGDYVTIEPMVKHWVTGLADSQLILIK